MTKPIAVVTGGAGFIGSHMVDLLVSNNFEVRVIDNLSGGRIENLRHHSGNHDVVIYETDIRELKPEDKSFAGAEFVFHFAGIGDIVPSIERPVDYVSVNVLGTLKVLEASRFNKVSRVVYAASSSCYGLAKTPTDELHPIDTLYPYALSKYQGEQLALKWNDIYHLPCNSLRIFNAFGTRSRTSGAYGAVMGVFLKQKLEGKPFTVVGDGEQKRDFLYVTDVARAFFSAATSKSVGQIWNLGAGKPQSINTLVKILDGDVVYLPKRPGEPDCTWADISKISAELGWKPEIGFEAGVKKIKDDIEYWRNAPLWDLDSIAKATKIWFETFDEHASKKDGV